MSTTAPTDRARRARYEPLQAEQIAPGMFEIENLRSDGVHTVDVRGPACTCEDFQFRMGPADRTCKHIEYIRQVSDGTLCSHCGYETCRPSCPRRDER